MSLLLVLIIIIVVGRHRGPSNAVANETAASARTAAGKGGGVPEGDLTTVMEKADRAWLSDVGAGKVVTTDDGSDALSLPQTGPVGGAAGNAGVRSAQVAGARSNRKR